MSKPEKNTEVKPPEQREQKDNSAAKIIITNILTTAIVCIVFIGVFFVMQKANMSQQKGNANQEEMNENVEVADDEVEKGIILDLGEFTMNLADVSQKRYLKVEVALEVTKNENDTATAGAPAKAEGEGGGEAAPANPKKISEEMEHYKPAIRDAVITTLTSKMSDELSTTTGKELAKDQIKEAVDAIFAGEREVIRVSFGQFIIQ